LKAPRLGAAAHARRFMLDPKIQTDRIIRAVANPNTTILSHMTACHRCYPATPCPIVRAARSASAAMVSVGGCIPAVGNTIPPTMNRLG
jgi:hypothetical protein